MSQNEIVLVVSISIFRNDEVLIIKENKPSAINKWNFPSGRIELGEDILYATCREAKEETGFDVTLNGTTGVYNFFSNTNNQVFLFHFTGQVTGGSLLLEEDEIIDSQWVAVDELLEFDDEELREPGVLKQIINNLLNRVVHPITLYNKQITQHK